jgi:hypothetical protein
MKLLALPTPLLSPLATLLTTKPLNAKRCLENLAAILALHPGKTILFPVYQVGGFYFSLGAAG